MFLENIHVTPSYEANPSPPLYIPNPAERKKSNFARPPKLVPRCSEARGATPQSRLELFATSQDCLRHQPPGQGRAAELEITDDVFRTARDTVTNPPQDRALRRRTH